MPYRADRILATGLGCSICIHIAVVFVPQILPFEQREQPGHLAAPPAQYPSMQDQGKVHAWLTAPRPRPTPPPPAVLAPAKPIITPAAPENQVYEAAQLTETPEPVGEVPLPDFPAGISSGGTVELSLLIDPQGKVLEVSSGTSSMDPRAMLETLEAFRHIRFRPGTVNGTPVTSRIRIVVTLQNNQ